MIRKACNKVGCSELIPRGQTPAYCDKHKKEHHRRYDARKNPERVKFYKSARWERLAKSKRIEQYYLCEQCGEQGNIVHHIIEISTEEGWAKRFDRDNLQLVCTKCHEKEHDRFS